jgi:hypothetical protein
MDTLEIIRTSFLSPLVLAFLVGMAATLIKSELEFPQPVLNAISIYLVFSIALKGGTELSAVGFGAIWQPVLATLALVLFVPSACYVLARRFIGLDIPNAALYGSVSSVTFLAAISLADRLGDPAEPFMPALVSLMEWGILVALFIARWRMRRSQSDAAVPIREIIVDTLRGRSVILLLGGLFIGYVVGEPGFQSIKPFFEDAFRGVLTLFLLEMGMVAARQLREFFRLGLRLLAFGIGMPLFNGALGIVLGTLASLSVSGSFVLGAITASASYIDAPAAVRAALPQANPSIYLTSSLGITFPFNLLIGLPVYYQLASLLHGLLR